MSTYNVGMKPIIKIDIKDNKIRVIYTLQYYDIDKKYGGGIIRAFGNTNVTNINEKWEINKCYPFSKKDCYGAKKTSSKALLMANAYSNIIINNIETVVKKQENNNW